MHRCGSKNGHRNGIMFLKEVGLCTQNVLTIVGSIVNLIKGDLYDHS